MNATKDLPSSYTATHILDLSKDRRLLILLNLAGLVLLVGFGWLFVQIAGLLRPEKIDIFAADPNMVWIFVLLLSYVLTLVLHELVHGLFFWLITRERPVFGLRTFYAYACAPGWYLPRNPYLMVGLAPLVLISLLGIAFIPFVPASWLNLVIFNLTLNAAGAVGDIYVITWLVTLPSHILVQDQGDELTIYQPGKAV